MAKDKVVYKSEVVNPENPGFVEEDFLILPTFDDDGVQVSSGIDRQGREVPDPVPMAPPVGFDAPPDLMDMIRSMVRHERFNEAMAQQGFETFEEADDLDFVEDDAEFGSTPYEAVFDPVTGLPVDRPQGAPPAPPLSKEPPSEEGGGADGGVIKEPPPSKPPISTST